jgi:hypothetical protein
LSARLCDSLAEVANSPHAPYFYEGLLYFAARPVPSGPDYSEWREERRAAMAAGREIFFCGSAAMA